MVFLGWICLLVVNQLFYHRAPMFLFVQEDLGWVIQRIQSNSVLSSFFFFPYILTLPLTAWKLQLCSGTGKESSQILPCWHCWTRSERRKPYTHAGLNLAADEKVGQSILVCSVCIAVVSWCSHWGGSTGYSLLTPLFALQCQGTVTFCSLLVKDVIRAHLVGKAITVSSCRRLLLSLSA